MNIDKKDGDKFNFPENLQPLFDAMNNGRTVKSVTCMSGRIGEGDTSKDFVALDYYVAFCSGSNGSSDLVDTNRNKEGSDQKGSFYMNWVRSFELYDN